jgi:tRNA (guanine-N7-)-methyltransferase
MNREADGVRTFAGRQGRLGPHARADLDLLLPRWVCPVAGPELDLSALFGNNRPVVLELGSGMGETTAAMAADAPDVNILASEVHALGVARLVRRCHDQHLTNVRICPDDGLRLLRDRIRPDSLAGVRVLFPDPWPKARHHKRRIIRPERVELMRSRLVAGGFIHVATDWREYADAILEVLSADPELVNTMEGFAPRPLWRPVTRFEAKGLSLGHCVRDAIFIRRPAPL